MPYPIIMNGLFLPILSLQYPEIAFNKEAVLSATPSINEIVVLEAPIDNKKRGITLYTILADVSVKKLVSPVKNAFGCSPNIFFLVVRYFSICFKNCSALFLVEFLSDFVAFSINVITGLLFFMSATNGLIASKTLPIAMFLHSSVSNLSCEIAINSLRIFSLRLGLFW